MRYEILFGQDSVCTNKRAGSQDLERSAVGRPNAEVCAAGVKKTSEVKDLSSRVDGRPVFVPPRATISTPPQAVPLDPPVALAPLAPNTNPFLGPSPSGAQYRNYRMQDNTVQMYPLIQVANPQAAEAVGVGEAEAEGEEEAIPVKMIGVIIVKIMDTGNVIVERNNVTRDTIEDSSKVLIHPSND
ncbi:hypothetical protein D4764_0274400 [Takifugu flavidus]|uniref:Uncharacterized protein n=1 Tax=Takifugu flavidus TaxID=433684 RepID=A0A5C6MIK7_9TELE|nr:hypothetical protein D4764_0274400 [Takifugu flavidus]